MKNIYLICLLFCCVLTGKTQTIDWPILLANHDLVWNNTIDANFFHGAFIGDGVQGAMVMEDVENPNGIRMLMSHYKAYAHYVIPDYEYSNQKVYAGNIIIAPTGTTQEKNMRMNIYDGEVSGDFTSSKGSITWRAFSDRNNNVFIVVLKGESEEKDALLGIREEWGITPRIYLDKKDPAEYASHLPPQPELSSEGDINLVINKMKNKGAHVVASQLIKESDDTQILYVAIGTDDNTDRDAAAAVAQLDAISRVLAAVAEGYANITIRHREWWHNYMESSYIKLEQDQYWEKFWYIQMYKFACAASEKSDLIMDTQGPWMWEAGWGAIWWNLNAQLSYMPMFSGNKLGAGKAFINGMNRIYNSGAFAQNASGVGIDIGRSSSYDGIGSWGDEYGNMPWLLFTYWRYWKFSGNDDIAHDLFPMLKDNATFLISKLNMESDGKYHLLDSRSPEYEDTDGGALHPDANYSLMSVEWVLQTLLDMNEEFGFSDAQEMEWREKLNKLTAFPTDDNGYKVNSIQGFDAGHRHPSHLMAIYPYHTITPEQGKSQKELIEKSLERWQTLTQERGYAGYTFSLGSSMYSTLGKGDKALSTLNLMKNTNLIQQNTLYREGGGQVVETPLSVVETVDYMLLQSQNGIVRIFPALPSAWENVSFKNLRTEGAFLISASSDSNIISNVTLHSEKGQPCTMVCPWEGKVLAVKDETGNMVNTTMLGDYFVFNTEAGNTYTLTPADPAEFKSGKVEGNANSIQLKLSVPIIEQESYSGLLIKKNENDSVRIQEFVYHAGDSILEIVSEIPVLNTDELKLVYANGNVLSIDSIPFKELDGFVIDNLLSGSAPRLLEAITNAEGTQIGLVFNKKIKTIQSTSLTITNLSVNDGIAITSQEVMNTDSTRCILELSTKVFLEDSLVLNYSGSEIRSVDNGLLGTFDAFPVQNYARGLPPQLLRGILININKGLQLTFTKALVDVSSQAQFFMVKINGSLVTVNSASNIHNVVYLQMAKPVVYGDEITVGFENGQLQSTDGGELTAINDFSIENTISTEPPKPTEATAIQSSTEYGGEAKLAIDGNTDGTFFNGSVTHTSGNSLNPWWSVDFSVLKQMNQITIWNRTDCCGERLANFFVFVSEEPFSSNDPEVLADDASVWSYFHEGAAGVTITIDVDEIGQYVRIQIPGNATLSLAEVQFDAEDVETVLNIAEDDIFKVYPNPVKGQRFFIELGSQYCDQNCDFQLFDSQGRFYSVEASGKDGYYELAVRNNMSQDIYFLVLRINGKSYVQKLIVS